MFVALFVSPAFAVGFQFLSTPDETGRPIEVGIWYPSDSVSTAVSVGSVSQNVALNGQVTGSNLPLVLLSHGSAGWFGDRKDTAIALAEAGFVAVSLTYPGDNYRDSSDRAGRQMTGRPVVTSRVLDYVLEKWAGRAHVDASRVGFYGFSAGGFTGLVLIGGVPDWEIFSERCTSTPDEGVCKQGVAAYLSSPQAAAMPVSIWHRDKRIKAAALASPGFGFAFDPSSLGEIDIPVGLWGGEKDAVVPFESNVAYLGWSLRNVVGVQKVTGAQHYSFLRSCSAAAKAKSPDICTDLPGFDRAAFQKTLDRDLVSFFQLHLLNSVP
jgi:predicted dienelactone hydrolase